MESGLMVAGCSTKGCDGIGIHIFNDVDLCCECYEKAMNIIESSPKESGNMSIPVGYELSKKITDGVYIHQEANITDGKFSWGVGASTFLKIDFDEYSYMRIKIPNCQLKHLLEKMFGVEIEDVNESKEFEICPQCTNPVSARILPDINICVNEHRWNRWTGKVI